MYWVVFFFYCVSLFISDVIPKKDLFISKHFRIDTPILIYPFLQQCETKKRIVRSFEKCTPIKMIVTLRRYEMAPIYFFDPFRIFQVRSTLFKCIFGIYSLNVRFSFSKIQFSFSLCYWNRRILIARFAYGGVNFNVKTFEMTIGRLLKFKCWIEYVVQMYVLIERFFLCSWEMRRLFKYSCSFDVILNLLFNIIQSGLFCLLY